MLPEAAGNALSFAKTLAYESANGGSAPPAFATDGDVAIVSIEGPLYQRAYNFCDIDVADGYDAIERRARLAFGSDAVSAVMLDIDSPGGECAGCQELADLLRAMSVESGKPLHARASEMAASAAYWLACSADEILIPKTGSVGSIGTIVMGINRHGEMAVKGQRVLVTASPRGKMLAGAATVLNPEDEETMRALAARMQARCDEITGVFSGYVAERRRMTADTVIALDAAMLGGAAAVSGGLADRVLSRGSSIDYLRSKVKRKVHSMADTKEAASSDATQKRLASLMAAVGLDASSEHSDEVIEKAVRQATEARSLAASVKAITGLDSASENVEIVSTWKRSATEVLTATREKLKARTIQLAVSTGRMTPAQAYDASKEGSREFPALPAINGALASRSLEVIEAEIEASAPHSATLPTPKPKRVAHGLNVTEADAHRAGFTGPNAVAEYSAYLMKHGPVPAGSEDK